MRIQVKFCALPDPSNEEEMRNVDLDPSRASPKSEPSKVLSTLFPRREVQPEPVGEEVVPAADKYGSYCWFIGEPTVENFRQEKKRFLEVKADENADPKMVAFAHFLWSPNSTPAEIRQHVTNFLLKNTNVDGMTIEGKNPVVTVVYIPLNKPRRAGVSPTVYTYAESTFHRLKAKDYFSSRDTLNVLGETDIFSEDLSSVDLGTLEGFVGSAVPFDASKFDKPTVAAAAAASASQEAVKAFKQFTAAGTQ